jgi:hypothetical protein
MASPVMKASYTGGTLTLLVGIVDLYFGFQPVISPQYSIFSISNAVLILSGLFLVVATILTFKRLSVIDRQSPRTQAEAETT